MKTYQFRTIATMKERDAKNWYIDADIIRKKWINAETLKNALAQYRVEVNEKDYVTITLSAMRKKSPMYVDTKNGESKQIGYVITAKTSFQRDNGSWIDKYIYLWVTIDEVNTPDFRSKLRKGEQKQ